VRKGERTSLSRSKQLLSAFSTSSGDPCCVLYRSNTIHEARDSASFLNILTGATLVTGVGFAAGREGVELERTLEFEDLPGLAGEDKKAEIEEAAEEGEEGDELAIGEEEESRVASEGSEEVSRGGRRSSDSFFESTTARDWGCSRQ